MYILAFLGWMEISVLLVCFGVPLAMIIFLVKKFLMNPKEPSPSTNPVANTPTQDSSNPTSETDNIRLQLEEYDRMKTEGLISQEDYDAKKKKLLGLD